MQKRPLQKIFQQSDIAAKVQGQFRSETRAQRCFAYRAPVEARKPHERRQAEERFPPQDGADPVNPGVPVRRPHASSNSSTFDFREPVLMGKHYWHLVVHPEKSQYLAQNPLPIRNQFIKRKNQTLSGRNDIQEPMPWFP